MKEHPCQEGFTLLEVLVVLSIFAVLGAGAYRVLNGALTAHDRLRDRQQAFAQLTFAVRSMREELSQVVERGVRGEYGEREEPFIGSAETLVFSRAGWSNPLGHPRGDLQRVRYSLGGGDPAPVSSGPGTAGLVLQRHFWTVLDRAQDSVPVTRNLLPLRALTFYYLNDNGAWHSEWPPLSGTQKAVPALPRAVEIRFLSQTFGEIRRLINLCDRHMETGNVSP